MPKLAKVIGSNIRAGQTPGGFTAGRLLSGKRALAGRGKINRKVIHAAAIAALERRGIVQNVGAFRRG